MGIEQIRQTWEGQVLAIELHSADGRNELDDEAVAALLHVFEHLPPGAVAVTLHGVGGNFCGGRAAGPPPAIPPGVEPRVALRQGAMEHVTRLYAALAECAVPVAAFAEGLTSGLGCGLLACADLVEAEASAVFDAPERFDVRRSLSPQQVGYGAGGPHFCLGANLARRELSVIFDEIRRRVPDLAATGEPDRVVSMALNSVRSLPASIRP